ncbi:hypothetical protein [Streptomyces sp. NPDC017988]|uniref:hypothetical protein n=1 Tax=Streptomyces sp. NPDC017988 TaxID=3365025 RepID=UPI0037A88333
MANDNEVGHHRAGRIFETVTAAVILATLGKLWAYDPVLTILGGVAVGCFTGYYFKAKKDGDSSQKIGATLALAVLGAAAFCGLLLLFL